MAIDFPTLLQGLGASAMAFADPRQSLLMSQGIFERNRLARERKERQEQQRQALLVEQQRQAQAQARWQAEQAVREGRLGLAAQKYADAQQLDQRERAELAAFYGGGAPNTMPAAAPNPFDLSGGAPYTAVSGLPTTARAAPTDAAAAMQEALLTGMPALPQVQRAAAFNTLQPSLFSPRSPPPPGFGPPGQAAPTGDVEQDAYQQWLTRYRGALSTGNKRIIDAVRAEKPPASLVKLQMGEQGPEPESGFSIARDAQGNVIYEDWTDPVTRQTYRRPKQIPAVTKPPGAEETRGLALAGTVLNRSDEIYAALDNWTPEVRTQYAASGTPFFGQFFSNTTGGQLSTKVKDIVQNSTYLVSGAEAPPREVQQRIDTYAPKAWDSAETIRLKLDYLTAVARNIEGYRLNKGLAEDRAVPESVWRDAFTTAEKAADVALPVAPDGIPDDYSFSSYDPATGVYQYQNEKGQIKYWRQ